MAHQPETRLVKLCDLQPSQLYISREKLTRVQAGLNPLCLQSIDAVPFKDLDGLLVMTDGHTRAFAVFLAGFDAIPAYPDPDELDWDAYRICVSWCHAEEIYSIADLASRLVDAGDYERLWHDRCRVMQAELKKNRAR
ncbi:MAG TPA: hypothetical protein PLE10_07930 [Brevefilum sp.]|nr:hypothetical protein [Brevefilum sp.]HOR19735.1 hypothetical protein [Brevefilum sp.]HPL70102.1 hypothetical protein [Brevefilum sp.]